MASTVVTNFTDLKAAALDPSIDLIYVNADITLESGGIRILKNKPELTIDCLYPQDETGVVHSITDLNNNAQGDAIRVALTSGSFHLTLKNCIAIGRNFYGIISCENGSAQNSTVLTLENVQYSGPQAAYNRYGKVELIGGSYQIGRYNGTSSAVHETVEANIVTFEGDITVSHDGTPNSCFYMSESNPQFIIKPNAYLFVTIVSRELIYCDTSVAFIMENDSRFYARTPRSLLYSSGMYAREFTIGENAEFVFEQLERHSGVSTIQCSGAFTALSGSRIILKRIFSATEPLIRFSTTATASFQNPEAVVLYNSNGRVISWSAGVGTLNIDAEIINYWLTAADLSIAGTFADLPLYNWFKADGSNATINATLSSSSTTAVTTNLIQDVDAPIIPNTSSFNVQNARVLAFGRLPLTVNPIRESDTEITGTTLGITTVRLQTAGVYTYSASDESGDYYVFADTPIRKSDILTVSANKDFKIKSVQMEADGSIGFLSVPDRLPFQSIALPVRRSIYKRQNDDWQIVVRDSRENGGQWSVYANAPAPLSSASDQLPDALVFGEQSQIHSIEGLVPIKIFTGEGNTSDEYTDTEIGWSAVEGLLLRLVPLTAYQSGHYESEIIFTLEEE